MCMSCQYRRRPTTSWCPCGLLCRDMCKARQQGNLLRWACRECWAAAPQQRPTFGVIVARLGALLEMQ